MRCLGLVYFRDGREVSRPRTCIAYGDRCRCIDVKYHSISRQFRLLEELLLSGAPTSNKLSSLPYFLASPTTGTVTSSSHRRSTLLSTSSSTTDNKSFFRSQTFSKIDTSDDSSDATWLAMVKRGGCPPQTNYLAYPTSLLVQLNVLMYSRELVVWIGG